jgi:hypothetical protein
MLPAQRGDLVESFLQGLVRFGLLEGLLEQFYEIELLSHAAPPFHPLEFTVASTWWMVLKNAGLKGETLEDRISGDHLGCV